MTKRLMIIFTAVISACSILFASECMHRRNASPEERADWLVNKIKKELNLSPEQYTELNKIKEEILAKQADFKKLREGFYEEAVNQIRSSKFDINAANQFFTSKEAEFKEIRVFLISELAKFHEILTPEQREKWAQDLENHFKKYSGNKY